MVSIPISGGVYSRHLSSTSILETKNLLLALPIAESAS